MEHMEEIMEPLPSALLAVVAAAAMGNSVLKDNHERVLLAILTLLQSLCRSTLVCEFSTRDHTPLAVLFKLVCGAVSVELKGGIFRTFECDCECDTVVCSST